ncbi:MAG: tetratricopeptide repeat protein [Bryobacteraceae bacterium]|nr:tetratricopeptide repeat protein [Bryobacteraceae bacterium]
MSTTTAPLPADALQQVIDGKLPLNVFFDLPAEQIQALAASAYTVYEQGRTAEAKEMFEGLVALDSTSYYGYAGLGAIALAEEDLQTAHANLAEAAKRNPKDATVQANLGEVLLRQGKGEEAAEAFRAALELDPQGKDPGANRARAILHGMSVVVKELEKAAGA